MCLINDSTSRCQVGLSLGIHEVFVNEKAFERLWPTFDTQQSSLDQTPTPMRRSWLEKKSEVLYGVAGPKPLENARNSVDLELVLIHMIPSPREDP